MKKQTKHSVKAHLLWSALILLVLVAVCAIPFALGQRQATKRTVTNSSANIGAAGKENPMQNAPPSSGAIGVSAAQSPAGIPVQGQAGLPATSNVAAPASAIGVRINPPAPQLPNVVLYDQINNPAPTPGGVTSQDFEAANDAFDSFAADDFVVPAGQTWNITEVDVSGEYSLGGGPAASFNVFFYQDSATLPGTLVATRLANPYTSGPNALITLTSQVTLTPGTYWVSVQSRQDFTPAGQWFWDNRAIISNSGAAWQNPGGGFGVGCLTYGRKTTCLPTQNGPDQLFRLVGTIGGESPTPTATATATPSGTPGVCQFHVLIVYADTDGPPTQLQSEIQAEPNVVAVDLFDANVGTPTLGQLQQYEIVVPFSNSPFFDADTLGNNLADYVDSASVNGGRVVVQYGFSSYGPGQPYGINGRWISGNYNPYTYSTNLEFNAFTLGTHNAAHPLMAGVTTLNSDFANIVTIAAGATEVAQNSLGESLVAYRPVGGGHTTVAVTAYVGFDATQSGDWGKVIVNAGNWLTNCQGPTPTATATATATHTP